MKNKILYGNAISEATWDISRDDILADKIFLTIVFKNPDNENIDTGKMNFYFDMKDPIFRENMVDWFKTIVDKDGKLYLCDGSLPSIEVNDVPLDIPKLMIRTKGVIMNVGFG